MKKSDGKEIGISENKIQTMVPGIGATILLFSCFVFAYGDTLAKILKSEAASDGFHSLIVAGISIYIVWRKKPVFSSLPIQPNLWAGSFVTLLGCMMLVAGKLSSTPPLKEISFVPTLLGVVWLCLGGGILRELWFPIACLIFMFTFVGGILSDVWSIYLQYVAAWIAAQVLGLAGMPVLLEGQYITLPNIKLEVARVCNGANHIITLVAFAMLLAWADQSSRLRKGILIFSGFFIAILANGLRVGAIGLWSSYNPNGPLHGPRDIFYVSVIFIFGMVLLLAVNLALRKWLPHVPLLKRLENGNSIPLFSRISLNTPVILASGLVFFAALYANLWGSISVPLVKPLEEFPMRIGEWVGEEGDIKKGILSLVRPDSQIRRVYRDRSGHEIQIDFGYFSEQNEDKKFTSYKIEDLHDGAKEVHVPLGSGSILVNRSETQDGKHDKILYFWYDVNGRVLSGRYAAKAASLYDAFLDSRTNGAIVIISSILNGKENIIERDGIIKKFIKEIYPLLKTSLS